MNQSDFEVQMSATYSQQGDTAGASLAEGQAIAGRDVGDVRR